MKDLLSELDMPDMKKPSKILWENLVNKKMEEKNKTDLVKQSERYKKINTDEMKTENFERKADQPHNGSGQARPNLK